MSHREKEDFKWGLKSDIRSTDSDVIYYRSFIYQGVEYFQFDCVYLYREGAKETDIGKIIRMWEKKKVKRLKVLWFFRPVDICSFLRDYEPSWNELFLASGNGNGLCNIVPLEAIIGKCIVICTSKDNRNTLPSKSDLWKAEYFFSHVFDIDNLRVSSEFPDKIETVKVERLFNQDKDKPKANVSTGAKAIGISTGARAKDCGNDIKTSVVKDETSRTSEDFEQLVAENQPFKKRIRSMEVVVPENLLPKKVEDPTSILDPLFSYNSRSPKIKASDSPTNIHQSAELDVKDTSQPTKCDVDDSAVEISRRPAIDKRRWFNKLPWEERVKKARDERSLVYMDNLDSSCTSCDVQDMIYKAFHVTADAKIIPYGPLSSPSYGQALIIFGSEREADFVISELRKKCLMVGEGRPVVAYRSALKEPGEPSNFHGHLALEKLKKVKWDDNKKKAVSTSHCSQPNTLEYDMATQWHILQKRTDNWWKTLPKRQADEISKWQNQLKSRQSNECMPEDQKEVRDQMSS